LSALVFLNPNRCGSAATMVPTRVDCEGRIEINAGRRRVFGSWVECVYQVYDRRSSNGFEIAAVNGSHRRLRPPTSTAFE
jgi:hypothetical protein